MLRGGGQGLRFEINKHARRHQSRRDQLATLCGLMLHRAAPAKTDSGIIGPIHRQQRCAHSDRVPVSREVRRRGLGLRRLRLLGWRNCRWTSVSRAPFNSCSTCAITGSHRPSVKRQASWLWKDQGSSPPAPASPPLHLDPDSPNVERPGEEPVTG